MTCRFVACEGGEGRGGRSSAFASRGADDERQRGGASTGTRHGTSFRGCSRGQCQRRVRRERMRTITGARQCRRRHSPLLGQGQDPSHMRTGSAATPATDPGIEG